MKDSRTAGMKTALKQTVCFGAVCVSVKAACETCGLSDFFENG